MTTNTEHKPGANARRRMSVEEEYWSRKFGVVPGQMKARQNARTTPERREAGLKQG